MFYDELRTKLTIEHFIVEYPINIKNLRVQSMDNRFIEP